MSNLLNKETEQLSIIKKFIKNIIAGNNVSKNEILKLYHEILYDQVESKVNKLFASHNLESVIKSHITQKVNDYFKNKMTPEMAKSYYSADTIETLIKKEIQAQVIEHFNKSVKITVNKQKLEV